MSNKYLNRYVSTIKVLLLRFDDIILQKEKDLLIFDYVVTRDLPKPNIKW